MKLKTPRQMERHLKGLSHHSRIEIILLLQKESGLTLEQIAERIGVNERTTGHHTRTLERAGLINKKYKGKFVEHRLSPYGKNFARCLAAFQKTTPSHT